MTGITTAARLLRAHAAAAVLNVDDLTALAIAEWVTGETTDPPDLLAGAASQPAPPPIPAPPGAPDQPAPNLARDLDQLAMSFRDGIVAGLGRGLARQLAAMYPLANAAVLDLETGEVEALVATTLEGL